MYVCGNEYTYAHTHQHTHTHTHIQTHAHTHTHTHTHTNTCTHTNTHTHKHTHTHAHMHTQTHTNTHTHTHTHVHTRTHTYTKTHTLFLPESWVGSFSTPSLYRYITKSLVSCENHVGATYISKSLLGFINHFEHHFVVAPKELFVCLMIQPVHSDDLYSNLKKVSGPPRWNNPHFIRWRCSISFSPITDPKIRIFGALNSKQHW